MNALIDILPNFISDLIRHPRRAFNSLRVPKQDYELLKSSILFDHDWYVARRNRDPIRHFLAGREKPGGDPHPLFNTRWYIENNPEVRRLRANPLVHYLKIGARKQRDPHPLFDTKWYVSQVRNLDGKHLTPLEHFLLHGAARGLNPNPFFDTKWYCDRYPNVGKSGLNPLVHYLLHGAAEFYDPSPRFSTYAYSELYSEVLPDKVNVLAHFLELGRDEGKIAKPDYGDWIARHEVVTARDRDHAQATIKRKRRKPLISVLMPAGNGSITESIATMESLRKQLYPMWELCISGGVVVPSGTREVLRLVSREDRRIKCKFQRGRTDLVADLNSALKVARGKFVLVLAAGDELSEDALHRVAREISEHRNVNIIYSDEDQFDLAGKRSAPKFKPDWNEALILSHNYIGHLAAFRTSLVNSLGGFRQSLGESAEHDLVLRCSECCNSNTIRHISKVLYHSRFKPDRPSVAYAERSRGMRSAIRAVSDHFERRQITATVAVAREEYLQVQYALPAKPPRVSVLIPTACKLEGLKPCMQALLSKTTYPDFEVHLLVNEIALKVKANEEYLETLRRDKRVKLHLYPDRPFNFAWLNNWGAKQATGSVLCLMNDDVEVITPNWLEQLTARVLLDKVAAVGPMMYYPNGRIQHAGVVLGVRGVAYHMHSNLPKGDCGYMGRAAVEQDLSCITAACMLVRRSVFEEMRGFNEKLEIAFNDVDFCIRVRRAGWRILWTPSVEMYHHESTSLGRHNSPERAAEFQHAVALIRAKWAQVVDSDPHYNSNLSLNAAFELGFARPPNVKRRRSN